MHSISVQYKTLEAMLHEVKTDFSKVSDAPTTERLDSISARTRGLSSPFKCIAGMVQQMNQEKDQELSSARLRIEELESMAASRYKEVNIPFQDCEFCQIAALHMLLIRMNFAPILGEEF